MPVMVMVTGSPSGSVTPSMETSSNLWFGGHSCRGAGSATAAVQSGGGFPGCPGRVVVVVDEVVVVGGGGRVVVVVVLEVVGGGGAGGGVAGGGGGVGGVGGRGVVG